MARLIHQHDLANRGTALDQTVRIGQRALPGGFNIARARTSLVIWFARSFLENNDPKPVAESIRKFTKVYPYEAGSVGGPQTTPASLSLRTDVMV